MMTNIKSVQFLLLFLSLNNSIFSSLRLKTIFLPEKRTDLVRYLDELKNPTISLFEKLDLICREEDGSEYLRINNEINLKRYIHLLLAAHYHPDKNNADQQIIHTEITKILNYFMEEIDKKGSIDILKQFITEKAKFILTQKLPSILSPHHPFNEEKAELILLRKIMPNVKGMYYSEDNRIFHLVEIIKNYQGASAALLYESSTIGFQPSSFTIVANLITKEISEPIFPPAKKT